MTKSTNRGFFRAIIIIIVALLVLKYVFNMSIYDVLQSQLAQDIWSIIKQLWALLWQAVVITFEFVKDLVFNLKDLVASAPQQ